MLSLFNSKAVPNEDQQDALKALAADRNIFLTGPAGTGKSFVIRRYLDGLDKKHAPPLLASTGAAAVLIGGRTFHSFFGLGIMEGGIEKTIERVVDSSWVTRRIKKAKEIVIDEISMIHPNAFMAANRIAQLVKENPAPFGGMRLILIGDFFQLPPVDRFEKSVPWLFESDLWLSLDLKTIALDKSMRTEDQAFVAMLNQLRFGKLTKELQDFLQAHTRKAPEGFKGTMLFGRKAPVESYNQKRLEALPGKLWEFETEMTVAKHVKTPKETLSSYSPLPESLVLKEGALVMLRKNDMEGRYVNGSLALITKIAEQKIDLELLSGGAVSLEKDTFQILDGDGNTICTIRNFPLTLGWATTIHKAQGASIDRLCVNLRSLWENGQAYVALSRAKSPEHLYIEEWGPESVKADARVKEFYGN